MAVQQMAVHQPSERRVVLIQGTSDDVEQTVARARGGDRTALLSLMDHCRGAIMSAIASTRPPASIDLDEAAHLARLKIFERSSTGYDGTGTPCSWMAVVARNRTRDHVRAEGRHSNRAVSIDLVAANGKEPSTIAETERVETWDLVYRVLTQLPDDDAELLKLHYLHGLTRHELAERLGYTYDGVRSKLNRACTKAHRILIEAEGAR
ncbi:MAG: sigma-70 family RNA polymerase sigma factor [Acidimicrobiia bacterium]|nr:sigma-70 family RNA polymerase sigma factor [Acidimicrobiia bacterium]